MEKERRAVQRADWARSGHAGKLAGWHFLQGRPRSLGLPCAWGRGLLRVWSPVNSGGKKLRWPQTLLLLSLGCRMLKA